MPRVFWKYKDEFVFYTQLLILILILTLTTLINAGWDPEQINYVSFGLMTFLSLYSKSIGMNYSSNKALTERLVDGKETNEVLILEREILKTHKQLLAENRTGTFDKALKYRNYGYRLRNEILKYDKKSHKSYSARTKYAEKMKKLHAALAYLNRFDFDGFDNYIAQDDVKNHFNIKAMSWYSMRRSNLKMSSLFSLMSNNIDSDLDGGIKSISFNKWRYAFQTQIGILIVTPIIQIAYTGLTVNDYVSSKQIWLDFMGYLVSIAMGLFNGFNVGTESITRGYLSKLQERTKVIQEISNIEKKIKVEKTEVVEL
jgi:hypothetical protein